MTGRPPFYKYYKVACPEKGDLNLTQSIIRDYIKPPRAGQTDPHNQLNQAAPVPYSEQTSIAQSDQAASEQTIVDEIQQTFDNDEPVSDEQIIELFEYLTKNNLAILTPEMHANAISEQLHGYFSDDLMDLSKMKLKLKDLVQINYFKQNSLEKTEPNEIIRDYLQYIERQDPNNNYKFSEAYIVAYSILLPSSNSQYALPNLVTSIEEKVAKRSVDPRLLYRFYLSLLNRANSHGENNNGRQNSISGFVRKYQQAMLSKLPTQANSARNQSNEGMITYEQLWDLLLITQQELKESQNLVSSQDFQGWFDVICQLIDGILSKQPNQQKDGIDVVNDVINSILQYNLQAANRQESNPDNAISCLGIKKQVLQLISELLQDDARYVTPTMIQSINSAWSEKQSEFAQEMEHAKKNQNEQLQQQATEVASEFLTNFMQIVFSHNTLAELPDRDRNHVLANLKALFKQVCSVGQTDDTLADNLENALQACHNNQTTIDNRQASIEGFISQLQTELKANKLSEQLLEPAISAINNMMESIRPYADESNFKQLITKYDRLLHAINEKQDANGNKLNLLQQLSPATLKRTALNVTWLFSSGEEAGQVNHSTDINLGQLHYSPEKTMKIQYWLCQAYNKKFEEKDRAITSSEEITGTEVNKWLLDSFDEVIHEPAFYQDFNKRQRCFKTNQEAAVGYRIGQAANELPTAYYVLGELIKGACQSNCMSHVSQFLDNEIKRYQKNPNQQQSSQTDRAKVRKTQVDPGPVKPKTAFDNIRTVLGSRRVNQQLKEHSNSQSFGNIVRSLLGFDTKTNQQAKQLKKDYLKNYLQKDGYFKKDGHGKRHFYLTNDYARSLTFEPDNVYKITEQDVAQLPNDGSKTDAYDQLDAMFKQPRVGQTQFMKTLQNHPEIASQVIKKLSEIPNQDKRDEYLKAFFQKGWSQTRNKRVEAFLNNDQLKGLAFELHCDGQLPKDCYAEKQVKAGIKQDCIPYLKFILQKYQNGEISQVNKCKKMLQVFQDALGENLSHQDVLSPEKIQKFQRMIQSALEKDSTSNESLEQPAHDELALFSTYLAQKDVFDQRFSEICANGQELKFDDVKHLINEYALFKKGVCFSNNDRSLTKIMKLIEDKKSFQQLSKIEKQEYYVSCVIAAYADEQDDDNNVDQQQVKDILENNTINDLTVIERYLQPSSHDNNWSAESRLIVFQKVFTSLAQNKGQDQQKCQQVFKQFCNQRHRGLTLEQYYQYAKQLFRFANLQDWLVHADIKEGLQKLADNLSQKIDNFHSKYAVLQNWQQNQYGQYVNQVKFLISTLKQSVSNRENEIVIGSSYVHEAGQPAATTSYDSRPRSTSEGHQPDVVESIDQWQESLANDQETPSSDEEVTPSASTGEDKNNTQDAANLAYTPEQTGLNNSADTTANKHQRPRLTAEDHAKLNQHLIQAVTEASPSYAAVVASSYVPEAGQSTAITSNESRLRSQPEGQQSDVVESIEQLQKSIPEIEAAGHGEAVTNTDNGQEDSIIEIDDGCSAERRLSSEHSNNRSSGSSDRQDSLTQFRRPSSDDNDGKRCQTPRSLPSNKKAQPRPFSMSQENRRRAYSLSDSSFIGKHEEPNQTPARRQSIGESTPGQKKREPSAISVRSDLSWLTDPKTGPQNDPPTNSTEGGHVKNLGDQFASAATEGGPSCTSL